MKYVERTMYIIAALLASLPAAAQTGNVVNPTPGAVWTYLGPTLGADWTVGTGITGPGSSVINELAVWNNITGTVLRNGGAVTHSGTIDLNATATLAGGIRGFFAGYPQNLNVMQDTTRPGVPPTQFATINTEIDLNVPGGFAIAGSVHIPFVSDVQLTGAPTFATAGRQESFVGGWLTSGASASCGGTVSPGTSACKLYGAAITTGLNAGATGMIGVIGAEIDTFISTGASGDVRVGLDIVDLGGTQHGVLYDAAIMIGATAGSIGHSYGIDFGSSLNSIQGVSTTGTLIGADMAYTVTNLIDFHNVSCTGTALQLATGLTSMGCNGSVGIKTATASPALSVQTTGAANAVISILNAAGGQQDLINFIEGASTLKWSIGKDASQAWYQWDFNNSDAYLTVAASGILTLGEAAGAAGNQLLLSRTGAASLTHLPGAAGAGGLYVCADTAGALYRKAACP